MSVGLGHIGFILASIRWFGWGTVSSVLPWHGVNIILPTLEKSSSGFKVIKFLVILWDGIMTTCRAFLPGMGFSLQLTF
ncbi:hypothetical protein FKM82_013970 [Ascaphus truei]